MSDSREDKNAQVCYDTDDEEPSPQYSDLDDDSDDDASLEKAMHEQYLEFIEEENNKLKEKMKELEHKLKIAKLKYEHLEVDRKSIEVYFELYKEKMEKASGIENENGHDACNETVGYTKKDHFKTWLKEVDFPTVGLSSVLLVDSWTGHCPSAVEKVN
ncbi:hypothetical protein TSAR_010039 [Trichomalopsis sarcophagae]|uniref:Uncharacterized protein n=1 Tax=Trichomalopsis sarcophagae TaxID=543379 RepID=A0A232ER51_9HYME|nr:hypothetical protein TSAR_010039 [Trichomalopsis sarcophagae]